MPDLYATPSRGVSLIGHGDRKHSAPLFHVLHIRCHVLRDGTWESISISRLCLRMWWMRSSFYAASLRKSLRRPARWRNRAGIGAHGRRHGVSSVNELCSLEVSALFHSRLKKIFVRQFRLNFAVESCSTFSLHSVEQKFLAQLGDLSSLIADWLRIGSCKKGKIKHAGIFYTTLYINCTDRSYHMTLIRVRLSFEGRFLDFHFRLLKSLGQITLMSFKVSRKLVILFFGEWINLIRLPSLFQIASNAAFFHSSLLNPNIMHASGASRVRQSGWARSHAFHGPLARAKTTENGQRNVSVYLYLSEKFWTVF